MATPEASIAAPRRALGRLHPDELPPWTARALLAAAMIPSIAAVLWVTRGQTFLGDEWAWFASYPGFDLHEMLQPYHGGHLTLGLTLLYKGVVAVAGPSSIAFRLVLVTLLAICALLFFLLVRRRVGEWPALAGSVLILTFGAAGETLGATLGIGVLATIALGLGALLLLERSDTAGDLGACALLVIAIGSYGPSFAFVAGATVAVLIARGPEGWRRWWVFGIPLVLYGAWRLWAGSGAGGDVTLDNLMRLPSSMLDSAAAALASMSGLFDSPPGEPPILISLGWGRVLVPLAVAIAVAILLVRRRSGRPVDRWIWVFVAMPLVYWATIGAVGTGARPPDVARYQLLSAILIMLLYAQLGAGMRIRPPAAIAIAAVLVTGVAANLASLREFGTHFRANSDENRAQLAAIELAREAIDPTLVIEAPGVTEGRIADMVLPAGDYLAASDAHGSPAFSLEELPEQPQPMRRAADAQLVRAYGLRPRDPTGPSPTAGPIEPLGRSGAAVGSRGDCLRVDPQASGASATLLLPPGGFALRSSPGPPASLTLGRWADPPASELPEPLPGRRQVVPIPDDADPTPWRLEVAASTPVTVCSLGAR